MIGPILEYSLKQEIFDLLNSWSNQPTNPLQIQILIELLKMYETIVNEAQLNVLHQWPVVDNMMKLLRTKLTMREGLEKGGGILVITGSRAKVKACDRRVDSRVVLYTKINVCSPSNLCKNSLRWKCFSGFLSSLARHRRNFVVLGRP